MNWSAIGNAGAGSLPLVVSRTESRFDEVSGLWRSREDLRLSILRVNPMMDDDAV